MGLFHSLNNHVLVLEKTGQPPVWSCDLATVPSHGIMVIVGSRPETPDGKVFWSELPVPVAESLFINQEETTIIEAATLGRLTPHLGKITFTIESEDIFPLSAADDSEPAKEVILTPESDWTWGDYHLRVRPKTDFPSLRVHNQRYVLAHSPQAIGKGTEGDLMILPIPGEGISRNHCHIQLQSLKDGNYHCWIEDDNSKNGTYVNKEKLRPHNQKLLRQGDVIQIGHCPLSYDEAYIIAFPWFRMVVCLMLGILVVFGGAVWYYIFYLPDANYWYQQAKDMAAMEYFLKKQESEEDTKILSAESCLEKAKAARNSEALEDDINTLENNINNWFYTATNWKKCQTSLISLLSSRSENTSLLYGLQDKYKDWKLVSIENLGWNEEVRTQQHKASAWKAVMEQCMHYKTLQDNMQLKLKDAHSGDYPISFTDLNEKVIPCMRNCQNCLNTLSEYLQTREKDLNTLFMDKQNQVSSISSFIMKLNKELGTRQTEVQKAIETMITLIREWLPLEQMEQKKETVLNRLSFFSEKVANLQQNLEDMNKLQDNAMIKTLMKHLKIDSLTNALENLQIFLVGANSMLNALAANSNLTVLDETMKDLENQSVILLQSGDCIKSIYDQQVLVILKDLQLLKEEFCEKRKLLVNSNKTEHSLQSELSELELKREGALWSRMLECDCLELNNDKIQLNMINSDYATFIGKNLGNALFASLRSDKKKDVDAFTYNFNLNGNEDKTLLLRLKSRLNTLHQFIQFSKKSEVFSIGHDTAIQKDLLVPAKKEWECYKPYIHALALKQNDATASRRARLLAFVLCKFLEIHRFDNSFRDRLSDTEALQMYNELKTDMITCYKLYFDNNSRTEQDIKVLIRLKLSKYATSRDIVQAMCRESLPDSRQPIHDLMEE